MFRIGNFAIAGAIIGWILFSAASGFLTQSNMAGFVGLMFGVPVGIIAGVVASTIWSKETRSGEFVFWWIVSAVMAIYLLTLAVLMFLHWKNGVAG